MDEFEQLATTGDWWTNPWWDRTDRQVYSTYTKEDLLRTTEVLRRYFDSTWTKQLAAHPRKSFLFPSLCIGGSTMDLTTIVELGKMISRLEPCEGFQRAVTAIKGIKEESAFLELETAFCFACGGFEVRFPQEGQDKSPDLLAALGDLILAVECKRLQRESWEDWEDELTREILRGLPERKDGKEIVVNVHLDTRLTQVRMGDKERELNDAFRQTVTDFILEAIESCVRTKDFPLRLGIEELAQVDIAYKTEDSHSSVTGMERVSAPLTRRILQNGVIRACDQLPPETPGVIVVYSHTRPTAAFFKMFFDAACKAQPQRFSSVVAVLLCSLQTLFRRSKPFFLFNPDTRFPHFCDRVESVLTTQFGGIPVR